MIHVHKYQKKSVKKESSLNLKTSDKKTIVIYIKYN